MNTKLMIATAAAAALLAGSAFAQSATAPDTAVNPAGAAMSAPSSLPKSADMPQSSGDTAVNPPVSAGPDATVAPAAGAPAERTSADAAADIDVVTNGPIPDTKANRAKYGKPLSNAGRMSKPAGN